MPSKGTKRGHELEKAVKFIQETILKSDPKLQGTRFSVEMNKIINVSGVHHEIDVLVKTLPDSPFESTWIFECKDWQKPVGKNEVIILATKVDAIRANRGFLVARRFTKDAEAQIVQDARLSLIPCTNELSNRMDMRLIYTTVDPLPMKISIKERGVSERPNPKELDWEKLKCRMNGELLDFRSYIGTQIDQIVEADQRENSAQYISESTHFRNRGVKIDYQDGELVIDKMDVEYLIIPVQFWVTVSSRKLISKFELKDRGRHFSFEPIEEFEPGKKLEINVVQRI